MKSLDFSLFSFVTGIFIGLELILGLIWYSEHAPDFSGLDYLATLVPGFAAFGAAFATIYNQNQINLRREQGEQLAAQINAIPAIIELLEHVDRLRKYHFTADPDDRAQIGNYSHTALKILSDVAKTGTERHTEILRKISTYLQISQSRFDGRIYNGKTTIIELAGARYGARYEEPSTTIETISHRLEDINISYLLDYWLSELLWDFRSDQYMPQYSPRFYKDLQNLFPDGLTILNDEQRANLAKEVERYIRYVE